MSIHSAMIQNISGFTPQATLVLGQGLTREDWKALCFQEGRGLLPSAILKPKDIALLIVPEAKSKVLDTIARQELLRQAFLDPNVKEALPVLREHRFRPRFLEGVDQSLQQGRLRFANQDEAQVFQKILDEKSGKHLKREEYFLLNLFWDRLLEVRELWDEPLLYSHALERLDDWIPPKPLEKIFYAQHFPDPPRLKSFWQRLESKVDLERIPTAPPPHEEQLSLRRKSCHSLEDAALFLIDSITQEGDLDDIALVIEDQPAVRRTVKRVAEQRRIPLQDARDPMAVTVNEELKKVMFEFESVARRLTQDTALLERYPSRMTLGQIHSQLLRTAIEAKFSSQTVSTLDRLFQTWSTSLEPIQAQHRKQPIRIWLDQITERLQKASPQVEPNRLRRGLRIFRVDQAVNPQLQTSDAQTRVIFFGVSARFFEPTLKGEEWFTPSDLETLSGEFDLPTRTDLQNQNLKSFWSWTQASAFQPEIYEWEYSEGGHECEPIDLGLALLPHLIPSDVLDLGAHPTNLQALQSQRESRSEQVQLPLPKLNWPISFLNSYGNCPFTAYAQYLLSTQDEEAPDFDLRPSELGSLVHRALEILVVSEIKKDPKNPAQAFDLAWQMQKPMGWLTSQRMFSAIRNNVVQLLEGFVASEMEYRAQSGTHPLEVEFGFEMELVGLHFKGRADRIDQHADGLLLIDYKTSSKVVQGETALERGKGLQLAIYSLGLRRIFNQEMVGATYLQLASRKIARTSGIYFQKWNRGKKGDPVVFPLTTFKRKTLSLFQDEPEQVWSRFEAKLTSQIGELKAGEFSAIPADPSDCGACRVRAACGVLRRGNVVADADGE